MRTGRSFCTLKKRLLIILGFIFAVLSGLWYAFFYERDASGPDIVSKTVATGVPFVTPTVTPKTYIAVHICGQVVSPGVVYLETGSRIKDAVDAAEGFTEDADRDWLNLASYLKDGERVYVPAKEETAGFGPADRIAGAEGKEKDTGQNAVININTADAARLTTLPGIGTGRANDIIAYRERVGRFEKKEDIKNVSGIGEALYSRIADRICTE